MSFPRYPAYKPSGVGEVPEHWSIIRLKNVLQCRITDGPIQLLSSLMKVSLSFLWTGFKTVSSDSTVVASFQKKTMRNSAEKRSQ